MIDWRKAFAFDTPPLEIVLRGTLIYLGLFFLLRVILKRQSGTTGVTDLLVIVLLADAAQNGMADDYTSISSGIVLVATIIAWSVILDWVAFRFPPGQPVHPAAGAAAGEGGRHPAPQHAPRARPRRRRREGRLHGGRRPVQRDHRRAGRQKAKQKAF